MPKEFKAVFKILGLPFTFAATILVLAAYPLIKISKLMGHTYWQW